MHVDGAVLNIIITAPDSIQQLSSAKSAIGMGHKGLQ